MLTFKTRAESVPRGWTMRTWADPKEGLLQAEKIVACPERLDDYRVRCTVLLGQMTWLAWMRAEDLMVTEGRVCVATEQETMCMEIGRRMGAVLVFVEDLAPAFLSVSPHSASVLENSYALVQVEECIAMLATVGLPPVAREEFGSSRHGRALQVFRAEPAVLGMIEVDSTRCCTVLAWPILSDFACNFPPANYTKLIINGEYEFKMAWDTMLEVDGEYDARRVCEAILTLGATVGDQGGALQRALVCLGNLCWAANLQCPTGVIMIEGKKHCPLQAPDKEDLVFKFEGLKALVL